MSLSYKPKQDVELKEEIVECEANTLEVSDESGEEWYDDIDKKSSVCSCDILEDTAEDWNSDSDHDDSYVEGADFSHQPSTNWLADNQNSCNKSRSIVFDSCSMPLFQLWRRCGVTVKNVFLIG